jgi:trigger factor
MQVEIADTGTLAKRVSVSYTPDEVKSRREQVLRKLSTQVKMPGFRPGKSTLNVVEKRFGAEATARAEEELANEGLNKAVTEHKLKPIGPVKPIESKREQGLRLVFGFEVRPAVTLPDPKSLALTRDEIMISDQQIDDAVATLSRRGGQLTPLAEGETLQVDDSITLTGKVSVGDAVARELHDFHHLIGAYPLLGKKPDEVQELLKGKGVGANVEFATTLPASFAPAEFAGKEAKVSVVIAGAQRTRAAAIDDELAKKLGLPDLATLKNALRENLKRNQEGQQHQRQLDELTVDLLAKTKVELPPQLLENLTADRLKAALAQLEQQGKSGDAEAKAKAEAEARKGAEDALKRHIILGAIGEQHKVTVTREDLEQQIQMAAQRSNQTPEAISKRLMDSGRINDVVEEIREAKTLEVFLELALGREPAKQGEECAVDHVHGPSCSH